MRRVRPRPCQARRSPTSSFALLVCVALCQCIPVPPLPLFLFTRLLSRFSVLRAIGSLELVLPLRLVRAVCVVRNFRPRPSSHLTRMSELFRALYALFVLKCTSVTLCGRLVSAVCRCDTARALVSGVSCRVCRAERCAAGTTRSALHLRTNSCLISIAPSFFSDFLGRSGTR